jgi:diguanylate cyclase (GGDEF)-like protein
MRISTITNWAYGLTLILTFSAGAAFLTAESADRREVTAVEHRIRYLRIADDVELAVDRLTEQARLYALRRDPAHRVAWAKDAAHLRIIDHAMARLGALGFRSAEAAELRSAEVALRRVAAVQRDAIAAADRGDTLNARRLLFDDRYLMLEDAIDGPLDRLKLQLSTRADDEVAAAGRRASRLDALAKTLLVLTATLFLAVLYFVLARRVAGPLRRMSDVVTRMADHDFADDMPDDRRRDEIGDVTQALRSFRRNAMERDALQRQQEQEWRTKDRLSRMMRRMQGCESESEVADVVARFAPQVFPHLAGSLFGYDETRDLLTQAAQWQDPRRSEVSFATMRCWALRRGRPHRNDAGTEDVVCQHLRDGRDLDRACLCIPLVAHGQAVGMLFFEEKDAAHPLPASDLFLQILAENVGMALANQQLRAALSQMAVRDPLTGLANRRHLEETLRQNLAAAAQQQAPVACLMIDIDHFKRFNDEYGHDAGDVVMQHVAQVLRNHACETDLACRYGGEEFTLIMPGADAETAAARAEDIRTTIRKVSVAHRGRPLHPVTVSIGVASYPAQTDAANLLGMADAALLEAKRAGRDQVVIAGASPAPRPPMRAA